MAETGPGPNLDKDEIAAIAKRLQAGEYLDEYYRSRLFPASKEVGASYAGKAPPGVVLAETMAVPFQTLRSFGPEGGGWTNRLIQGDNLQVLKTLLEMKAKGELKGQDGTEGFRLCYIDPPFATRREFRGKQGEVAYRDKVEGATFVEFLRKRLVFVHELLAEGGSLYLHLDTRKVHAMKLVLDELFGENNFRNEVIWQRTSAHSDAGRYGRIHDVLLFYTKGDSYVWHPQPVAFEPGEAKGHDVLHDERGRPYRLADASAASGGPTLRYEYKGQWPPQGRFWAYSRANFEALEQAGDIVQNSKGRWRLKRYLDEMPGVQLQDLWTDIQAINSAAKERSGYPTQKPLSLVKRIVEVSSNPGDLVLDCFLGSGTTAVAAESLNRRWVGIDSGKLATYTTQKRLLSMTEGKGKSAKSVEPRAFDLCSAGHYDNALLESLPFETWEPFCLELFGSRVEPHRIAGVQMSGTRHGDPVHTFPFPETEGEMGELYIQTLHDRLKGKVGNTVYVIAPASACDPALFRDLVRHDDTNYFILRVPYSVIKALHERDFKQLGQPVSESQVNDALDAYGFDFVEVPEGELSFTHEQGVLEGHIESFYRGGLDPDDEKDIEDAGRGDLAMVLVDSAYDGDIFKVSDYYFAEDLHASEWRFEVPLPAGAEKVLVIVMDYLGNERRETVELVLGRPEAASPENGQPAAA